MTKIPYNVMVKSDIFGRLQKIRDGVVYSNILSFVFELIQNCQRAGATQVEIVVEYNTITILDNGIGCDDPTVLFTLDISGFKIGFGEGLSSIYTIGDFFNIRTLDWKGSLDIEKAMRTKKEEDLQVQIEPSSDFLQGFEITLQGQKIADYRQSIIDQAKSVCSVIPNIDFFINRELVEKVDIFVPPHPDNKYHAKFDNRIYEGRLWLDRRSSYGSIQVYYDYRPVCTIYENGLNGVIMIKPNKITLKAPDRQALIYDKKERLLMKQLRKDAKYLTKRVLNDEIFEDIEKYSEVISHYNSIEEVIRHLHVEDKQILNQYETRSQADDDIVVNTSVNDEYQDTEEDFYGVPQNNFSQHNTPSHSDINSALNVMSTVSEALPSLSDITQNYENPTGVRKGVVRKTSQQPTDTKRTQQDQKFSSYVAPKSSFVKKEDMGKVSIRNIAKKSNIVWVEKKYHEEKKDMIALYEYYGVFTFISPHILYDRALQFLGVPHIDTVKGQAIEKQYNVKRTGALTKKEERVMEILQFIEKKLGLENTFFISDIHCKMIVSLREKKIYQEKLNVEGYAQGDIIHLNRKSLKYGKISSILLGRETLSIHDVKFVLSNLELIAHELAHLIYNTQDNTKEHFMAQNILQEKIGKIIMDCDTLYE